MTAKRISAAALCLLFLLGALLSGCGAKENSFTLSELPAFSDEPYVVLDDNEPGFSEDDLTEQSFESYSPLDSLGRCGVAYACIGRDLMPTEDRGSIGQIKPTGWQTVKYDCVDGKYLYNRCHLIGFQLTGENDNERNLITGTRYLNVEGMLPFENMIADYIHETDNHVLYRVTPIFSGNNLVADGVHMEAMSVEDNGRGICFNIFAYNSQPGITIDYRTGESREGDDVSISTDGASSEAEAPDTARNDYILNTSSLKFHLPDCGQTANIKASNRRDFTGSREELIEQGYSPCKACNP